jgi:hypothetical protein
MITVWLRVRQSAVLPSTVLLGAVAWLAVVSSEAGRGEQHGECSR